MLTCVSLLCFQVCTRVLGKSHGSMFSRFECAQTCILFGARNGISFNFGRFRKTGIALLSMFQTKSCCNASRCSMPGTSQGWWHCNGSDDGPNVRPDHLRKAFTVALVRTLMCMTVVSCGQPSFLHMCCQHLAKLALHLRLVGRPFGECWCVTAGLLVHNLTGRLTWTISTCWWQLRLSSGSVTCFLKHLWILFV